MLDEQRPGFDVELEAPERIVERRGVVHVDRDERVDAGRLEKRRDVAGRDGIVRPRPSILAREREVRRERDDLGSARILQRAGENEQPHEFVRGAQLRVARERLADENPLASNALERPNLELAQLRVARARLADENPLASNALERPNLELAVLELALLVRREHRPELRGDSFAQSTSGFEAEDLHTTSSRGEPPPARSAVCYGLRRASAL